MTFSRRAYGIFNTLDPDVQLLEKLNGILKLMQEFEFENDITLIKTELYTARSVFLTAYVNEMNEYWLGDSEKDKARLDIESQINQFEELLKVETSEIMDAYRLFSLN